ncbi:MAG: CapA family protein [Tissierellia bacterium]|nr:CapA family protein [Tissierellia bacterium]
MKYNKKFISIFICFFILLIFVGCGPNQEATGKSIDSHKNVEVSKTGKKEEPTKRAMLFFVGDIIYHPPLYRGLPLHKDPSSLETHYERLKPWIEKADFAIGNFEGSMNPNGKVRGYPLFQVPHDSVASLKANGFDAMTTANNHCMDGGESGLDFVIEKMDEVGMKHFGTFLKDDSHGLIEDINGIKVGFLSYTEHFNGMEGSIPMARRYKLRPMKKDRMLDDIHWMKKYCDYLIVLPHWGEEYTKQPMNHVVTLAHELLDGGADAIIGSHPHVVHGVEIREDGKVIAYSLGNSLANQRREYMKGNPRPEGGLGLYLHLIQKPGENPKMELVEKLPTFTERSMENGKYIYRVMACRDGFGEGKFVKSLTQREQNRAEELEEIVLRDTENIGTGR